MKMKHLLIIITCIALLFTSSCKSDLDLKPTSDILLALGQKCLILQSSDKGLSWGKATVPASIRTIKGYETSIFDAVYANGKWVAVGGIGSGAIHRGIILTSEDEGKTWIEIDNPSTSKLFKINYGDGKFIAVGHLNNILTSTDGANWDKVDVANLFPPISGNYTTFSHVAIGNNSIVIGGKTKFVVTGFSGSNALLIESSDGGKTWNKISKAHGKQIEGLVYGDKQFVAVGDGFVAHKKNGVWSSDLRSGKSKIHGPLSYDNRKFIASISRSYSNYVGFKNETDWTSSSTTIYNLSINSILCSKNKYVLIGSEMPPSGGIDGNFATIYTSEDGLNWEQNRDWLGETLKGSNCGFRAGIYAHDQFVIVGDQKRSPGTPSLFYTSKDGINWIQSTTPNLLVDEHVYKIISNK